MASNASSYYLKVISTKTGEVKGEATSKAVQDQIEVKSFSFEADRPMDIASGTAAGRIICKELEFVIPICAASPVLLTIFFTNENIKTATLSCFRADKTGKEVQYLKWEFTDARIVSYRVATEEHFPYDTMRLFYAKAEYTYVEKSIVATWPGIAPATT